MKTKSEIALEAFTSGYNCAQAVVEAYREETGLDRETAMKVAAGFGGGLGRMAETCGAASGAVIVLGSSCREKDPAAVKARTYEKVKSFIETFKQCYGSVVCRDILGEDISTEEGRKRASERGLFEERCNKIVEHSVEILKDLI
jgi:C_GCAxxG_C_C family probable redox protein